MQLHGSFCFILAGPRGFEPRSTVLETGILPLNYRPLVSVLILGGNIRGKEGSGQLYFCAQVIWLEKLLPQILN